MPDQTGAARTNVDLLREAFAALNRKDLDACLALMTPDFVINIAGMPYVRRGHAAWRGNVEKMLSAFPDIRVEVQDWIAAGDKVAVRVRLSGTHRGEFLGNRPTGKRIDYESNEVYRVADGRLAEEWICSDSLTLMTQVGTIGKSRLFLMWLAGYRVWFAAGFGLAAGILGTLLLAA